MMFLKKECDLLVYVLGDIIVNSKLCVNGFCRIGRIIFILLR